MTLQNVLNCLNLSRNISDRLNTEAEVETKMLSNIENDDVQKIPYPKRVFFIIANEFCERLNFFGMASKLLFLTKSSVIRTIFV